MSTQQHLPFGAAFAAMVSVQTGAAFAKTLFPSVGSEGVAAPGETARGGGKSYFIGDGRMRLLVVTLQQIEDCDIEPVQILYRERLFH